MRQIQRLRTGFTASDRQPIHTPGLVNFTDTFDIILSRNLLAHLRRVAEATSGRLPTELPMYNKEIPSDPGADLVANNHAYLGALYQHLQRHFDSELLTAHYQAIGLCAEQLLRQRPHIAESEERAALLGQALDYASQLAAQQQDSANAQRWAVHVDTQQLDQARLRDQLLANWQSTVERPYYFAEPWSGIDMAGAALWQGCGITWRGETLAVNPTWPTAWDWWAILDLPLAQGKLSLVWDGQTLHSTLLIQSDRPVEVHDTIRARGTDELEFDLHFELQSERAGVKERRVIRPQFQ